MEATRLVRSLARHGAGGWELQEERLFRTIMALLCYKNLQR